MSWSCSTRDRYLGFHARREIDFSNDFYKNIAPTGMDKFKSVVAASQLRTSIIKNVKNSLSSDDKNCVKNSLDIANKVKPYLIPVLSL